MARPLRGNAPMPVVRLRADQAVWEDFLTATGGQHAEITRQFWAWYIRRPNARLPQRPSP